MSKPIPLNKQKYATAKRYVDKIYGPKTSAYKSMALVKKYKDLGGTYSKPNKYEIKTGVKRWLREKWIQVTPFINDNKKIPCGSSKRREHACRPSIRISKKTPITIQELINMHGIKKMKELSRMKMKNSEKIRIVWKNGKIIYV
jgi:hypothetical protein